MDATVTLLVGKVAVTVVALTLGQARLLVAKQFGIVAALNAVPL